jgi:hypothetical protein
MSDFELMGDSFLPVYFAQTQEEAGIEAKKAGGALPGSLGPAVVLREFCTSEAIYGITRNNCQYFLKIYLYLT